MVTDQQLDQLIEPLDHHDDEGMALLQELHGVRPRPSSCPWESCLWLSCVCSEPYCSWSPFALCCEYTNRYEHADWMQEISGDIAHRPIHRVAIPGTHDSGAFDLTDQGHPGAKPIVAQVEPFQCLPSTPCSCGALDVVRCWSKTQGKTLREQCEGGARYLDLRLSLDTEWRGEHGMQGALRLVHGLYNRGTFKAALL